MHGLVNHAVQCFLRDAYGAEAWRAVSRAAGVGPEGFEPMLDYDDHVTHDLLLAAARHLAKAPEALLEDLGTYLVSHDSQRSVRRLLRFSGATFSDFLHALDDRPRRGKLSMPYLDLPELELREDPPGCFRLFVLARQPAWGYVMLGLLRAMADDFGALVVIDIAPSTSSVTVIEISLHDGAFAAGRSFSLAGADPAASPPPAAPAPLAAPGVTVDSAGGARAAPVPAPPDQTGRPDQTAPPGAGRSAGAGRADCGDTGARSGASPGEAGGDTPGPQGAGATGPACQFPDPAHEPASPPGPAASGTGAGLPTSGGPAADEAGTGLPTRGKPGTGGPLTGTPTTGGPTTAGPETGEPMTRGLRAGRPCQARSDSVGTETDGAETNGSETGGVQAEGTETGGAQTSAVQTAGVQDGGAQTVVSGGASAVTIAADDPVERVLAGAGRHRAGEDRA